MTANLHAHDALSAPQAAGRRLAALVYVLFLMVVLSVFLSSTGRSVSQYYEMAANRWVSSVSLYQESKFTGRGFIYLPHAAILHLPFAELSSLSGWPLPGDVVWRSVSWLLFCWASFQLASLGLATGVGYGNRRRAPLTAAEWTQTHWRAALVTAMLAISCLRIGQSTLIMTSLMLLSILAWRREQLAQASGVAMLAVCFKPLAIVLPMLYFATDARTRKPLLASAVVAAVAPFLLQLPGYVMLQYQECLEMLRAAADVGNQSQWAQAFGMLSRFGIEASAGLQTGLRMAAALATLAIVACSHKWLSNDRRAVWLFASCGIYLMLFNPRTENSTYGLVGPLYGLFIADLHLGGKRRMACSLFLLAVFTTGSYEIGKLLTPAGRSATWLAPLCCCVFAVYLGARFRAELRAATDGAAQQRGGTKTPGYC